MTESALPGLVLISLAGAMSGTFSTLMKFTHRWDWEHIWGLGSLFALLAGWGIGFALLPDLLNLYRDSNVSTLCAIFLFGVGWGAGAILFGLGVDYVGVGLGVTLILGLTALVGTVGPLVIQHPERLLEPTGLTLFGGLLLMISGLVLLGIAGNKRESDQGEASKIAEGRSFAKGLMLCIASGLLSPLANFTVAFGTPLTQAAAEHHGMGLAASTAPWALAFAGCYGLNVIYCGYLVVSRNTAPKFSLPGTATYWLGALVMGVLWVGAMVFYGWGASKIGDWGPYVGFPLLMISSIFVANLWGAVLREWNGTAPSTKRILFLGLAVLIISFIVFGLANRLNAAG